MAIGKLFIGRKVRELRAASNATQSQFAERIGISTSYLNQIENNQRPVSATVLLALADKFQLDIAELSTGETDRLLSALAEALSDPLFEAYAPSLQELKLVTQNAPGLAHALITCHQAYRRNGEQLASMDDRLGRSAAAETTSYDEVRDFFHFVDNYLHDLDTAAEKLAHDLGLPTADSHPILTAYLEKQFGVRVVLGPMATHAIRQYEPASRVLTLNPYAPAHTRVFQTAVEIAQLHAGALADTIARNAGFRTEEAVDICRIGLHNYFAGALLMPYQAFLKAARELRHDIELLAARFGASLEQVCHRLSTLQRPGLKGVPMFFARIDRAGNITKRHSATKLQFARFGAACPLWNAHQAFETPGRIIRQLAETPDGVRYLCLAMQVSKGIGGFRTHQPVFALALGCEISYAEAFVYADGLNLTDRGGFDSIGISCRICERPNCTSRAVPPFRRKISVDHNMRETTPYKLW
ncbi:helix-turn-helix domain-containing protein [Neorhizobium alkalisoli]|uniref:helix-turn-helix domain-containing protein n=1 Tax=Neorhizobium alkalisoli TaxID=528178 RepID=UPI000CFA6385|nr:helix-turn-helix transcriptional regulator [Neorhizobium alkalisoli]